MVEALALEPGARFLDVSEDDVLAFTPYWEDRTALVHVKIVGIARPMNPSNPEWEPPALARLIDDPTLLNTLPVLVPEVTLVDILGSAFREMGGFYFWTYTIAVDRIEADDAEAVRRNIGALNSVLSSRVPSYRQTTGLPDLLAGYDTRLRFVQIPLAVVLLLVTAMVLYAVTFLAMLVTQRQRADAALMRSRGALTSQVFYIYAAQGFLIGGIAAVAGPFLAAGAIALLGYLPAFASLGNGGLLPVSLSPMAFIFGAVGGILSFGVLLIPIFKIARGNPLEERRQAVRPPQTSFVQRYYVDVGLAVAATLFLWQLGQQGSIVAGALSGQRSTDLFLLLVPALFLVSTALLLLRIMPLLVGLLARLIAPSAPTWLSLGLWQIGRNPLNATRLVLLLVLGAGLGTFAASFGGTLDRSYQERALYQAGSEIRLFNAELAKNGPSVDSEQLVKEVSGVELASLALRQRGSFASGPPGTRFELLAVDPDSFSEVAWWRDDFSDGSLDGLTERLRSDWQTPWGLDLPDDAQTLGVWIRSVEPDSLSNMIGVISDSNGRYFSVTLGSLSSADWTYLETPLMPQPSRSFRRVVPTLEPEPPYKLVSLQVVQRSRSSGMTGGAFFIDSVMTRNQPEGDPTLVRRFQDSAGWDVLNLGVLTNGDSMRIVSGAGRSGSEAALFSWGAISGFVQRGIYAGPSDYQLPVIVSPSMLRTIGQKIGDTPVLSLGTSRVPVTIVGVVDYIPTLNPGKDAGFIIANVDDVLRQQNLVGQSDEVQPNEIWVSLAPDVEDKAGTLAALQAVASTSRVVEREALLATSKADPLVAAGWGALLLVAYLSVLVLGVVGFVAHAILTVGERRIQYALLRTLGLDTRQIRATVWFEHLVVVVAGIGAGYLLGQRTGALLMPFLDRTEQGIAVLPPFIFETNWQSLGAVFGLMSVAFVVATAVVVRLYNRLALGQTLRIGEE